MSLRRILAWSLLSGAVLLVSGPAAARVEKVLEPHAVGWEALFKIEWEAGQRGKGQPAVRGYVVNVSPYTISRMQVLVDALDETGAVVGQNVSWVGGGVAAFGRVYFDVPAPPAGSRYRVRVYSYDRLETDTQGWSF